MKVKILEKAGNELKMEIEGESHTFCNVVQKALLKDERVDFAGYNIPHPLTASPVIYLRTKPRTKPEVVLRDAVQQVQKDNETFRAALDKASKEAQS
jgi:DNA-directed RNA polymerase subunit L